MQITVYGGAAGSAEDGEVGGNRILVEWDDRRWFLDFGMRFKRHGEFFAEFVKPRGAVLGLRDYLRLELLPPLEGLFREDLSCHDPECFDPYRDRPDFRRIEHVDGVLLSHAHLDHNGNIGFLRPDIPVYSGLATAVISKTIQDTKSTTLETELTYHAPREATDDGRLQAARKAPRRCASTRCQASRPHGGPFDCGQFFNLVTAEQSVLVGTLRTRRALNDVVVIGPEVRIPRLGTIPVNEGAEGSEEVVAVP